MQLPVVYNPKYSYPFPAKHRFPMDKFSFLFQHLSALGIIKKHNVFRPGKINLDVLNHTHCPLYSDRFIDNRLSKIEQY